MCTYSRICVYNHIFKNKVPQYLSLTTNNAIIIYKCIPIFYDTARLVYWIHTSLTTKISDNIVANDHLIIQHFLIYVSEKANNIMPMLWVILGFMYNKTCVYEHFVFVETNTFYKYGITIVSLKNMPHQKPITW